MMPWILQQVPVEEQNRAARPPSTACSLPSAAAPLGVLLGPVASPACKSRTSLSIEKRLQTQSWSEPPSDAWTNDY